MKLRPLWWAFRRWQYGIEQRAIWEHGYEILRASRARHAFAGEDAAAMVRTDLGFQHIDRYCPNGLFGPGPTAPKYWPCFREGRGSYRSDDRRIHVRPR